MGNADAVFGKLSAAPVDCLTTSSYLGLIYRADLRRTYFIDSRLSVDLSKLRGVLRR